MTVGGVDTYYDYDERQWKYRRLGGGPVRRKSPCPLAKPLSEPEADRQTQPELSPEPTDGR